MPGKHAPTEVRFWRYVNRNPDGCWEWTGSRSEDGYGRLNVAGRPLQASRISWAIHFAPIPADLFVCHHCDNPPCVRPDHLFLGTALHNTRDAIRKGRFAPRPAVPVDFARRVAGRRRLSDEHIAAIRSRGAAGESSRSIAREFGCHHTTVVRLLNGTHWRDTGCQSMDDGVTV